MYNLYKVSVLSLNLVGFNDTFNTIRLYKRSCKGCVQTAVLLGNHRAKSAYSLDYQHKLKRHPRKEIGLSELQTHKKWKRTIVSKKEKSCSSPM